MRKKPRKIAVLQLIPSLHGRTPQHLLRALTLLEQRHIEFSFHDLEANTGDLKTALGKVFDAIHEKTVVVALSCYANYRKIDTLIFLFLCLEKLRGKTVHICSPYLSLFSTRRLAQKNIFFHFVEIDAFLASFFGLPALDRQSFFLSLPRILQRYGYQHHRFWAYLTYGCRHRCTFCYNRHLKKGDPSFVRGDPDEILLWMRAAQAAGHRSFEFVDQNFLFDKARVMSFLKRYKKAGLTIPWKLRTRLDAINRPTYDAVTASGCNSIFFGVEHMSSDMLTSMNKQQDSRKYLTDFLKYWDRKTELILTFLTGIKGEDPAQAMQNLSWILKLNRIPGIDNTLSFVVSYDEKKRRGTIKNNFLALLYLMTLMEHHTVSRDLMKDFLVMSVDHPFFDFFCRTENETSLELLRQLQKFFQDHPETKNILPAFEKLMNDGNGEFHSLLLEAKGLEAFNRGLLTMS